MHKHWVGCHTSNFRAGRAGFQPEAIVIHASASSLAEIAARCAKPQLYNSVHYAVGADGEVHQYIEEKDTAFHAGLVVNPVWAGIKKGANPNLYTVGIEHENPRNKENAGQQYKATAELIADIGKRWKIAPDRDHIVLHNEIRAGAGCPGTAFDRAQLLSLLPPAATNEAPHELQTSEVRLLTRANIREFSKTTARVVRVGQANTTEEIIGFVQGERINGNACWYHTADGFYLWAGATDTPAPGTTVAPVPVAIQINTSSPREVLSGIPEVDNLLGQAGGAPIGASAGRDAVSVTQDLATGHGVAGLPTIGSATYGTWSQKLAQAIESLQKQFACAATGVVDKTTLQKLIETPATDARISRAYLTLVLGYPFHGLHKILSLVAQMEGAGKFAALNRNTDRAGLSFGLIQWAQKPGRLNEILSAMSAADRGQFVAIFGGGDAAVADALIAHSHKPHGGVEPSTGATVNPAFNLIEEPWLSRFRQAGLYPGFQKAQVEMALAAFTKSCGVIHKFAPELTSERALGFTLDVANQFGDAGSQQIYTRVHQPGMQEKDILEAMAAETVARVDDSFKAGVRARRDRFLETTFLADTPVEALV